MLTVSKILSEGFPHVRLDPYFVEDKIFFEELTFFHASGMGTFKPKEFEIAMGSWLKLPEPNKF